MSEILGPASLAPLLPESIRNDETIRGVTAAADGPLRAATKDIVNLLVRQRLDPRPEWLAPPLARLAGFAGGPPVLSDELLELLAWQVHVDFWDPHWPRAVREELVRKSVEWHRIKGTPASLKKAFALYGLQAEIEEDGRDSYWATYQLGFPQIADLETVRLVASIAYEMHPARCSLYRIYTDVWDVRPGSYDVGFYDIAAYDYYSGVSVPGLPDGGDLIVSFGRLRSAQSLPETRRINAGRARAYGAAAVFDDDMIYDVARYDDTVSVLNHGFSRSRLRSLIIGLPVYRRRYWTGSWDDRKWVEIDHFGYEREPFSFHRRSTAVIEGVYDESFYDGGIAGEQDAFYGQPVFTVVDAVPVYDVDGYDTHDPMRRTVVVDEMFENVRRIGSGALLPQAACAATGILHFREGGARSLPLLPRPADWSGGWDGRRWRAYRAQSNITHEETA